MKPDFSLEIAARQAGALLVAGVDEAGRGPLAGPVTAAAVILPDGPLPQGLNDSKKLTATRREDLARWITAHADWAVSHVDVVEIDRLNILQASLQAMRRAVAGLSRRPCLALIDGNQVPQGLICPGTAVVKGDARSLSIAAASIMAKVARDKVMVDLAQHYPGYGWEQNAGYPTRAHLHALGIRGVTPHHRRSFAPVHNILCKDHLPSL